MFAVTVVLKIREESMDAFLPLMIENAKSSLKTEPGCRQFDVCSDPARPSEIFLYEIYDDAAAFQAHLETPHFKKFDAGVAEMIEEKSVRTYAKVVS